MTALNGIVPTKLRLSCTIQCFAGAAVHGLSLTHGMGRSTTCQSIWGVIDTVIVLEELVGWFDGLAVTFSGWHKEDPGPGYICGPNFHFIEPQILLARALRMDPSQPTAAFTL